MNWRGWQIVPQVGVSGFRIDLGIRHPDHGGLYLAGIECDGATYHSSATARDRDKVREQVLCGLGWTILRVWSTDWWFDAEEAIERLDSALNDAGGIERAGLCGEPNLSIVTEGDTSADSALSRWRNRCDCHQLMLKKGAPDEKKMSGQASRLPCNLISTSGGQLTRTKLTSRLYFRG